MKPVMNHAWDLSPTDAIALQKQLREKVTIQKPSHAMRYIAGIDCAPSKDYEFYFAAALIWDLEKREVIEHHIAKAPLTFPYVPGLLSFREIPAILNAVAQLQ